MTRKLSVYSNISSVKLTLILVFILTYMNNASVNPTLRVHFNAVGDENSALIIPCMLYQVIFCKVG